MAHSIMCIEFDDPQFNTLLSCSNIIGVIGSQVYALLGMLALVLNRTSRGPAVAYSVHGDLPCCILFKDVGLLKGNI